jgi:hypothetical protein
MILVVHSGSRIRTFYPYRIPDPGVKKAPDPGSGSATLAINKLFEWLFSRVLASHPWRPRFDSRPGHVSLGTSSLGWRWPWSSLSIVASFVTSHLFMLSKIITVQLKKFVQMLILLMCKFLVRSKDFEISVIFWLYLGLINTSQTYSSNAFDTETGKKV